MPGPPCGRDSCRGSPSSTDADVLVAVVAPGGSAGGSAAALVRPRMPAAFARDARCRPRCGPTAPITSSRAPPTSDGGGVIVARNADSVRALTPDLLLRLALALAIGIVVAAVAAVIATRAVSRPLAGLASGARRMAGGERGVVLEPSTVAEIADVELALTALDDALTRSEGRQREFLLEISHELRTPLTAIRGYAEALGDGLVPADGVVEVGHTLEAESNRLTAFTNDLLALARLEADEFPLELGEVEVAAVLTDAANAWRASADAAGVAMAVTAGPPVLAHSDAARIRQLVDGLVENALRVSPSGTAIRMSASAERERIVIEVSDGGPGLTPTDAARAFERGHLRDRYRDIRPVGSGLGLSIAARLVDRLGGTITAGSAPAGGALFRIELPAGR